MIGLQEQLVGLQQQLLGQKTVQLDGSMISGEKPARRTSTTEITDDVVFAGKKTRKPPLKWQEEWWVTLLEYLRQDVMDGNVEDHIIKKELLDSYVPRLNAKYGINLDIGHVLNKVGNTRREFNQWLSSWRSSGGGLDPARKVITMSQEEWDAIAAADPVKAEIQQQWSKYNRAQYVIDLCELIFGVKGATGKNAKTGKRKPFNVAVKIEKEETNDKVCEEDEDEDEYINAKAWESPEDAIKGNAENVEGSEPKKQKSVQDSLREFMQGALTAIQGRGASAPSSTSSILSEQQRVLEILRKLVPCDMQRMKVMAAIKKEAGGLELFLACNDKEQMAMVAVHL